MPRQARIDQPGLLHHVIARGIEKRPIFLDDQDRNSFVSRLRRDLDATDTDCFAWVLMDTHFHLLLRPNRLYLADFMRRLLTGHTVVFNLRHRRSGHLFQNRYKSIVCEKEAYLLELVRYIHLNPLRAGALSGLEALRAWPWSGHYELIGKSAAPLIKTDEVFSCFSRKKSSAAEKYRSFIADGMKLPVPDLSRGGKRSSLGLNANLCEEDSFDERILGGGTFVDRLLGSGHNSGSSPSISFDELRSRVTAFYRVSPERLALPDKERSVARGKAVLCQLGLRYQGMPGAELGRMLALSISGVTRAARRGETLLRSDANLRRLLGL